MKEWKRVKKSEKSECDEWEKRGRCVDEKEREGRKERRTAVD